MLDELRAENIKGAIECIDAIFYSLISTSKVCGLGKGKHYPETVLHVHLKP